MTSEKKKIIDALKHCADIDSECFGCVYENDCSNARPNDYAAKIKSDAADMIEQQDADIQRLGSVVEQLNEDTAQIETAKEIVKSRLQDCNNDELNKSFAFLLNVQGTEIKRLSEELEQVKRERDAAITDLKLIDDLFREDPEMCCFCKYAHADPDEEPCKSCNPNPIENKWQWHGVCFENSGGDACA